MDVSGIHKTEDGAFMMTDQNGSVYRCRWVGDVYKLQCICYSQSMKLPIFSRNIFLFSYIIKLNRVIMCCLCVQYIALCTIHETAYSQKSHCSIPLYNLA